jgi:hypothetical protein
VGRADDLHAEGLIATPPQRSTRERFRFEYGAEPLHLLATLASLALVGYALLRVLELPAPGAILLWLGVAVIAHDLIALPLYTGLARIAAAGAEGLLRPRRLALAALNHLRVPAALSLLLLLISFPLVFELGSERYELITGLGTERYLGNWLGISAALFASSGLLLALRLRFGNVRRPMIGVEARAPEPDPPRPPGQALRWAARLTLAALAGLTAFVAALAIYGLLTDPPI